MNSVQNISKKELDFIISQGEGQFTEFKENIDKSLAKEIVAFANSNGGKILLGLSDNGKIKGFKLTNSIKSKIIDTALNCDPKIIVTIQLIDNVAIISVPESSNKPHASSNGFFLRIGANSQKLSRNEIFDFAISQGLVAFDEEINSLFQYPTDFDYNKFDKYLLEANINSTLSTEDLLINLGVAKYSDQKLLFNNSGVLFFAENVEKFFLTSKVVCAEFASNDKAKILDKKVYDDGILSNIIQSINFVTKHIKLEFVIETAKRKEVPQFPEEAYREAVVNAILHRDYNDKSSDVFIEVYRNQTVISNPGGLVKWLRKEDFGKISKTRNSIIASLLARTNYAEKMGTGITRMNNAMAKANLPKMLFDYDDYTFFTTLRDTTFLEKNIYVDENGNEYVDEWGNKYGDEWGDKYGDEWGDKYGENEKKVLALIKQNKNISIVAISKASGLSTSGVEKIIARLKKSSTIKRIGTPKSGYWKIIENE